MAGRATRGGTLDRVDRARDRPLTLDRRVLGQQARSAIATRRQARVQGRHCARCAGGAGSRRLVRAGDCGQARREPGHGPPLAAQARARDGAGKASSGNRQPAERERRRRRHCSLPSSWEHRVPAPSRGRMALPQVPCRSRRGEAPLDQGRARERGRRRMLPSAATARSTAALHFHHVDPSEKEFAALPRGLTRSIAEARAEAAKCVLLCANCHAEVEAGVATIDPKLPGPISRSRWFSTGPG